MNTQMQSANTFNNAAQAQSALLAAAVAAPTTDKAALQVSESLLVLDVISEDPIGRTLAPVCAVASPTRFPALFLNKSPF